jgi:hypothetical protein
MGVVMKTIKMVLLTGIFGALAAVSTVAVPLGMTFTGGVPLHYWGTGWTVGRGFQYLHIISMADEPQPGAVYLPGVNDILVEWDAPADCLYVLNQRPVDVRTPTSRMGRAGGQGSRDAFPAHSSGSVTASRASSLGSDNTRASGEFSGTFCLAGTGFVALLLIGRRLRSGRNYLRRRGDPIGIRHGKVHFT